MSEKELVTDSNHTVNYFKTSKKRKLFCVLATIVVAIFAFNLLRPTLFPPVENPEWGVSFSPKYAQEFGNDWQTNLIALLDDMGIKHYRLMSYWDEIEPEKGKIDFADLDWQINEIAQRGGTVSLAVGLRQPRWPECHAPDWTSADDPGWQDDLYNYLGKVIEHYADNPTVTSWQLENEYKNVWFGMCSAFGDSTDRAIDEMQIIRDRSDKPIYMSLSDQFGLPLGEPTPDKYGVSIYGRFYWDAIDHYFAYPNVEWWHRFRHFMIGVVKDRDTFVHEMQMEPWAKDATFLTSTEEQDKSMSADMIPKRFEYIKRIDSEEIYLWGGEWWYWRLQQGDDTIWNTVKSEINS